MKDNTQHFTYWITLIHDDDTLQYASHDRFNKQAGCDLADCAEIIIRANLHSFLLDDLQSHIGAEHFDGDLNIYIQLHDTEQQAKQYASDLYEMDNEAFANECEASFELWQVSAGYKWDIWDYQG